MSDEINICNECPEKAEMEAFGNQLCHDCYEVFSAEGEYFDPEKIVTEPIGDNRLNVHTKNGKYLGAIVRGFGSKEWKFQGVVEDLDTGLLDAISYLLKDL